MKVFWDGLIGEEKGSVIVLTALSMVMLLGFTALVTDIGLAYLASQKLSRSIDAAALAGAQELPGNPDRAVEIAKEYARRNGLAEELMEIQVAQDRQSLRVKAVRPVRLFFGRILGIRDSLVQKASQAEVRSLLAVRGAAPLAVKQDNFVLGRRYILKYGAGSSRRENNLGPGNFGALALGKGGADQYEENLKYGYEGWLRVGEVVDTQTGNLSGPTLRAIDYRLSLCSHARQCTPQSFYRDCPRLLIVPVFVPWKVEGQQVKKVKITGFAAFFVEAVKGQGKESEVHGYFVETLASGITGHGLDFGLRGVRLAE
ncbi:Tad domain-containing protein [Calderihabitans maritimus]|uniref:Putative Flp pilus-assembly TadG-like N-terminal domain-containing protein n=1 Tax=Calderihabitans maritimus TaxID=1246530 RepID=A0A1Z5HU19_9FIRM|nr:Tad domain-containing protein [Calderihabitans maritimus]GAW92837.1 hypothetical protein Slip_1922 [Calderihabitans maritimus]